MLDPPWLFTVSSFNCEGTSLWEKSLRAPKDLLQGCVLRGELIRYGGARRFRSSMSIVSPDELSGLVLRAKVIWPRIEPGLSLTPCILRLPHRNPNFEMSDILLKMRASQKPIPTHVQFRYGSLYLYFTQRLAQFHKTYRALWTHYDGTVFAE